MTGRRKEKREGDRYRLRKIRITISFCPLLVVANRSFNYLPRNKKTPIQQIEIVARTQIRLYLNTEFRWTATSLLIFNFHLQVMDARFYATFDLKYLRFNFINSHFSTFTYPFHTTKDIKYLFICS